MLRAGDSPLSGTHQNGGMTTPGEPRNASREDVPHLRLPEWGWDLVAVVVVVGSAILPGPRPPSARRRPAACLALTCPNPIGILRPVGERRAIGN